MGRNNNSNKANSSSKSSSSTSSNSSGGGHLQPKDSTKSQQQSSSVGTQQQQHQLVQYSAYNNNHGHHAHHHHPYSHHSTQKQRDQQDKIELERHQHHQQQQNKMPDTPYDASAMESETTLNRIVGATLNLSASLQSLPNHYQVVRTTDEFETWISLMGRFEYLAEISKSFVLALPGAERLVHINDRLPFADIWEPVLYAESNRNDLMPLTLSRQNADEVVRIFPEFIVSLPVH